MLYNTVLVSDMTHFSIKLRLFDILIFAAYTKILVKTRQVLRFEIIWKGHQASVFSGGKFVCVAYWLWERRLRRD